MVDHVFGVRLVGDSFWFSGEYCNGFGGAPELDMAREEATLSKRRSPAKEKFIFVLRRFAMKIKFFISIMLALWLGYSGTVLGTSGGIWYFNEGSGTTTADALGVNNSGTKKPQVDWSGSEPDYYLNYNGHATLGYVLVADESELDITGPLTLEANIRTSSSAMQAII
jgi:hypothetical protein